MRDVHLIRAVVRQRMCCIAIHQVRHSHQVPSHVFIRGKGGTAIIGCQIVLGQCHGFTGLSASFGIEAVACSRCKGCKAVGLVGLGFEQYSLVGRKRTCLFLFLPTFRIIRSCLSQNGNHVPHVLRRHRYIRWTLRLFQSIDHSLYRL